MLKANTITIFLGTWWSWGSWLSVCVAEIGTIVVALKHKTMKQFASFVGYEKAKGERIMKLHKYIASVSFGKDSLAMLLMLIEKECPLDEVIFYDTGMEFQAIYNIRDKVVPILQEKGIKYTELHPKNSFEYNMFERPVNKRNGEKTKGYSWCGSKCRWGTSEKVRTIEKYCKGAIEYIGIAYDESKRIKDNPTKKYPLFEWEITEHEALDYVYEKGFNYLENGIELYSILKRVSCWCCGNKNLQELRNYRLYLPKYWERLKDLQARTDRPYRNNASIFDLEKRFEKEEIENDNT